MAQLMGTSETQPACFKSQRSWKQTNVYNTSQSTERMKEAVSVFTEKKLDAFLG